MTEHEKSRHDWLGMMAIRVEDPMILEDMIPVDRDTVVPMDMGMYVSTRRAMSDMAEARKRKELEARRERLKKYSTPLGVLKSVRYPIREYDLSHYLAEKMADEVSE